jgi:hypothetical protein
MTATGYAQDDKVHVSGDTMTGTLELQGSPPLTIPEGAASGYVWTTPDGSGSGEWQPGAAHAVGDVTVAGSPSGIGQTLVSGGTTSATWQGTFGTRPEWFGTITGTTGDDVAINAAIAAVQDNRPGCPGPVVITRPCAISNTVTAAPGVNFACQGQGNRQVGLPDGFSGGYLFPASNFPSSTALVTVGTAGDPTTNPCGLQLDGLCLSGYKST